MPRVTICKGCGQQTTNGSRCEDCAGRTGFAAGFRKGERHWVYRTRRWQELSRRVIAAWVAVHGWLCPGWRRPAHDVAPGGLALDHKVPLSIDDSDPFNEAVLGPLCTSCNSRKSLSERPRVRRT